MAISQRKTTGSNPFDNGKAPASAVDGRDPVTGSLRDAAGKLYDTPQGETDQSDGPGSSLNQDRHNAVKAKVTGPNPDGSGPGQAI